MSIYHIPPNSTRCVAADLMPCCRMWMLGPVQWINLIGWRKLQDFEVHAMFIYWREMSVMMGCKWVPNTLAELENFRQVVLTPYTPSPRMWLTGTHRFLLPRSKNSATGIAHSPMLCWTLSCSRFPVSSSLLVGNALSLSSTRMYVVATGESSLRFGSVECGLILL